MKLGKPANLMLTGPCFNLCRIAPFSDTVKVIHIRTLVTQNLTLLPQLPYPLFNLIVHLISPAQLPSLPSNVIPHLNSPTQIPSLPFNLTLHFIPLTQSLHLYPDHPTQSPPFMEDLLPPPFSILPSFHPHLTPTKRQQ